MHNMVPDYVQEMLTRHVPTLRGERDALLLKIPSKKEKTIHYQMCYHWNSLQSDIRLSQTLSQFKTKLKTHYFNEAFNIDNTSDTNVDSGNVDFIGF